MKGLLRYLSPFAPDQSGAVSVFYSLGGLIVICDAGGCTGNICGFDEPRWFESMSAIFSAGLRDMDAILGRDDRLIEKLKDAADHLDASFAALIGTPVPAVIGTDFRALKRMAEKKTGLPVLTVECTGTRLYDVGASKAYLELFKTFAEDKAENNKNKTENNKDKIENSKDKTESNKYKTAGRITEATAEKDANILGVLGCTPLDISRTEIGDSLNEYLANHDYTDAWCYGMGAGLDKVKQAGAVSKNLVVAPSGIAAAEYFKERYGTPYETGYPFFAESFIKKLNGFSGKRILIVHQQVAANEIRKLIRKGNSVEGCLEKADVEMTAAGDITCGTWFMQLPELMEPGDVHFDQEDEFVEFAEQGGFDVIIADARFKRALKDFHGEFIDCPHFAVSGRM